MWPRICNCQGQSIAVFASGTANTLQKLTLCRRHTAQDDRGKVTNINTHFQSGGTGENIGVPVGTIFLATLKILLQLLTIWAFQQTSMLPCIDARQIAGAVKSAIVIDAG